MTEAIYSALTTVFRDVFDDDGLVIGPETTAADIPGWDSLAHIRLVVAAEQKFGIRFNSVDVGNLHNVGEFVALIAKKSSQ